MDLRAIRQKLYLDALEQAMRARLGANRGEPGAQHLEIVAADELIWINNLSLNDLRFLQSIRISP